MIAFWVRTLTGLAPASDEAEKICKRIGRGEIVSCDVKKPRSLRWHRLYFALCKIIADNAPEGRGWNTDSVDHLIRLFSGHWEPVMTDEGIVKKVKSISFAAMDGTEWEKFWEEAVKVCCETLIPGLESEQVKTEALQMVL